MANSEELSPLLSNQQEEEQMIEAEKKSGATAKTTGPPPVEAMKQTQPAVPIGWPADGLPLSVMGEPMIHRAQWDSSLCACLGRNDGFCSSDLEVCLLGSMAPCVLYGSNVERLGYAPAIRRKFNLEGSCEALARSCGCCGSFMENEVQREQCESACDFATHVFCHACALCQEGREVRRRLPHPGFIAQPVLVMIPPGEQAMGRGV
ncbi:PLAC8 family protein [Abeliophyllum distichum]|uniref:PLAC8 family protein n=1 Tax=Abeliophyllum distichum TaxID=126358 RepID=A0ABD1NRS3_9LAMI